MDVTNNFKRPADGSQLEGQPKLKKSRVAEFTIEKMPNELIELIFDHIEDGYKPSAILQLNLVSKSFRKFILSTDNFSKKIYTSAYKALQEAWQLVQTLDPQGHGFICSSMIQTWNCPGETECCEFNQGSKPNQILSMEHGYCKLLAAYDIGSALKIAENKPVYHFAIADTLHRYNKTEFENLINICFDIYKKSPQCDDYQSHPNQREINEHKSGNDFSLSFSALMAEINTDKAIEYCTSTPSFLIALSHFGHGLFNCIKADSMVDLDGIHANIMQVFDEIDEGFSLETISIIAHICAAVLSAGLEIPESWAQLLLKQLEEEEEFYSNYEYLALTLLMNHSRSFFQLNNETDEEYGDNCYEFLCEMLGKMEPSQPRFLAYYIDVYSWIIQNLPQFADEIRAGWHQAIVDSMHTSENADLESVAKSIAGIDFVLATDVLKCITCDKHKIETLLSMEQGVLIENEHLILPLLEEIRSAIVVPSSRFMHLLVSMYSCLQQIDKISPYISEILANDMNVSELEHKKLLVAIVKSLGSSSSEWELKKLCIDKFKQYKTVVPYDYNAVNMLSGLQNKSEELAALLIDQVFRAFKDMDDSVSKARGMFMLSELCLNKS